MKPIIGIVEWPYLDRDGDAVYEIRNEVIEWIQKSGGRPIGIFPTQIQDFVHTRLRNLEDMSKIEEKDLKESLDLCSAIIKPGAIKIYQYERYIYQYCLEKNKPYIGICAGMQVMANHGNPEVKLEKNKKFIEHYCQDEYAHLVFLEHGTKLKSILGKDKIPVNSYHHQHITNPGIHKIAAISEDSVIEAIENPNANFHFGFQWHPELLSKKDENSQIIFGEFIEAAKTYEKKK